MFERSRILREPPFIDRDRKHLGAPLAEGIQRFRDLAGKRAVVDASATLERLSAGVFAQGWTADEVATLTALLGSLAGRYPGATP